MLSQDHPDEVVEEETKMSKPKSDHGNGSLKKESVVSETDPEVKGKKSEKENSTSGHLHIDYENLNLSTLNRLTV